MKVLHEIQQNLKAPKGQFNKFGNYKYRSCEDILEAVKPLIPESYHLIITDEIIHIEGRFYVKATANLSDGKEFATATAWAREAADKKGMDHAQITGAASSYARKYALNGLFCIDDTKDPDSTNTHGKDDKYKDKRTKTKEEMKKEQKRVKSLEIIDRVNRLTKGQTKAQIKDFCNTHICQGIVTLQDLPSLPIEQLEDIATHLKQMEEE